MTNSDAEYHDDLMSPDEQSFRVRVLPDYGCWPTWLPLLNVEPASLGLPGRLCDDLQRWADVFDGTLNHDDPASSGFATGLEEQLFVALGRSLAREVAERLGESVGYFDITQRVHTVVQPRGSGT